MFNDVYMEFFDPNPEVIVKTADVVAVLLYAVFFVRAAMGIWELIDKNKDSL